MIDDTHTPLERARIQLDAITTEAHALSVRREYLERQLTQKAIPAAITYGLAGYLLLFFVLCATLAILGLLLPFAQTTWFVLLVCVPVCFGLSVIFIYGGLRGLHQEELRAIGPRYLELEKSYHFYAKMAALLVADADEPDPFVGGDARGTDTAA